MTSRLGFHTRERVLRTVVEDLVIATLAVNRWPLEKAYGLRAGLERQGLLDRAVLLREDVDTIALKLTAAGYRRGAYLERLLADRLKHVAAALSEERCREVAESVARKDRRAIEHTLMQVKGVGATVVQHFLVLQEGFE